MDAKAKAIEALKKVGFAHWFDEDSFIRKYPNGTSYATVGSTQTSVTLNVPHKDVPFLFPLSLSPEVKERLKQIKHEAEFRRGIDSADTYFLLFLIDRLTGGAKD